MLKLMMLMSVSMTANTILPQLRYLIIYNKFDHNKPIK